MKNCELGFSRALLAANLAITGTGGISTSTDIHPDIPIDTIRHISEAEAAHLPDFDWEGLGERYYGESFTFPIQVVYDVDELNYDHPAGETVSCKDLYVEEGHNHVDTLRACSSVGISSDANLTANEERQQFESMAIGQTEAINRALTDSNAPFRVEHIKTTINTGRCSVKNALCLIITNLLSQPGGPNLGLVDYVPTAHQPGAEYNNPQALPFRIDFYAQQGLKGCYTNGSFSSQTEKDICEGTKTIGNGVVAHEFGHASGLHHTFDPTNACTDGDSIPDTAPENGPSFYWYCLELINQIVAVVDSCRDAGGPDQQRPDNTGNLMGYYYRCDDLHCSLDGKTFTPQQILMMLFTIENLYPDMFGASRRSIIADADYKTLENGEIMLSVNYKAGGDHRLKLIHQDSSNRFTQDSIPAIGINQPTELGQTDQITYFVTIVPDQAFLTLYTHPFTLSNGTTVFENIIVWAITSQTENLDDTDSLYIQVTDNQPRVPNINTPTEKVCTVQPFKHYQFVPRVSKN